MSVKTLCGINFMILDFGMLAFLVVGLVCLWTGNWAAVAGCVYGYKVAKVRRERYRSETPDWARGRFGRKWSK